MNRCEIIGCPFHFGVSDIGLKKSIIELNNRFKDLNIKVIDEIELVEDNLANLKNLNSVAATCNSIAKCTKEIASEGKIPLFIGGDHASAMGTVSGVSSVVQNMGLIWIDSHSDIHTDLSTISGNIHGMPVSAIMGYGHEKLTSICFNGVKVKPENVVLFGLRDVDIPEQEIIKNLNIKCFSYEYIKDIGLQNALNEVKIYLKNINKLHMSFDLDSMDPDIIKGVTVPVKSGFHQDDVHDIFDYCLENFDVSSIDIVEYNPIYDKDLYTARFTYELICKIKNLI